MAMATEVSECGYPFQLCLFEYRRPAVFLAEDQNPTFIMKINIVFLGDKIQT